MTTTNTLSLYFIEASSNILFFSLTSIFGYIKHVKFRLNCFITYIIYMSLYNQVSIKEKNYLFVVYKFEYTDKIYFINKKSICKF